MTGIAFDEGWGSLGPGPGSDFSPAAMEGFRSYLEGRYSTAELAAKGIDERYLQKVCKQSGGVPSL